jgi:two-component system chemotaxis response regulator CheB
MTGKARVLVVDDSPTMRGIISAVLKSDPEIDVIGQACNAMEARADARNEWPRVS